MWVMRKERSINVYEGKRRNGKMRVDRLGKGEALQFDQQIILVLELLTHPFFIVDFVVEACSVFVPKV